MQVNAKANDTVEIQEKEFGSAGDRFKHILHMLGFDMTARGSIKALQILLQKENHEMFHDLAYPTVRAWLGKNAPPIKKMDPVLDALSNHYEFPYDSHLVRLWWKTGTTAYPFDQEGIHQQKVKPKPEAPLEQIALESKYRISGMLHMVFNDVFLSDEERDALLEKVQSYALGYANPDDLSIPNELLELILVSEKRKLTNA